MMDPKWKMLHSGCALVRHFQPRVHHIWMSHSLSCIICIMSGYDCLNMKRFSSRRKTDSELAATTSVGSVFKRNCGRNDRRQFAEMPRHCSLQCRLHTSCTQPWVRVRVRATSCMHVPAVGGRASRSGRVGDRRLAAWCRRRRRALGSTASSSARRLHRQRTDAQRCCRGMRRVLLRTTTNH